MKTERPGQPARAARPSNALKIPNAMRKVQIYANGEGEGVAWTSFT